MTMSCTFMYIVIQKAHAQVCMKNVTMENERISWNLCVPKCKLSYIVMPTNHLNFFQIREQRMNFTSKTLQKPLKNLCYMCRRIEKLKGTVVEQRVEFIREFEHCILTSLRNETDIMYLVLFYSSKRTMMTD